METVKLGKNMKMLRRIAGLSQQEFAKAFGTTQSRISDYETGKKLPPAELLILLAEEYRVSYDWLFTGEMKK